MRKATASLTANLAVLGLLSPAAAASTPAVRHPVPVALARRLVAQYEHHAWKTHARVGACRRRTPAVVICDVELVDLVIVDGTAPVSFRTTDEVTRSGPCTTPVAKRTSSSSGIAHGGGAGRPRNCFTGPLVVLPVPDSLHQTG